MRIRFQIATSGGGNSSPSTCARWRKPRGCAGQSSPALQRRLDGLGDKVDHSTAGAQEVERLAATPDDRVIAQVIAHAIAGHHAGLPDTIGDAASLDERLKTDIKAIDPASRNEITQVPSGRDQMMNALPLAIASRDKAPSM
jgi:hypothetical protein